jgi:hypothetical protein
MKRAAAFANGAARQRRHYPAFVALPLQQDFYFVNRVFPTGSRTIANQIAQGFSSAEYSASHKALLGVLKKSVVLKGTASQAAEKSLF